MNIPAQTDTAPVISGDTGSTVLALNVLLDAKHSYSEKRVLIDRHIVLLDLHEALRLRIRDVDSSDVDALNEACKKTDEAYAELMRFERENPILGELRRIRGRVEDAILASWNR